MPTTHPSNSVARSATLTVTGISKSFGDRRVLTDIGFSASQGDRIGLIGENGTGKSTLLSVIASESMPPRVTSSHVKNSGTAIHADHGTVSLSGTIGYLQQELPYPDEAPVSEVLDEAQRDALNALAMIERAAVTLAKDPSDPGAAHQYAEALETADHTDAWASDARRGEVLSGLGLSGVAGHDTVGALSGGQRRRLSLVALLLEAPQTILLDEPSNHLDDEALAYLESVLTAWKGIVIVASHDRTLLNAVTTRILDLDPIPEMARVFADAEVASWVRSDGHKAHDLANGLAALTPTLTHTSEERLDDPETDDPGSGLGGRMWNAGYSAARAERQAEVVRWRERYAAESDERGALTHEIEVGSREVNRKHESKSESRITRKFYADKDARVTSRRARNARVRLETLERDRVRRPPEPLRFGGIVASNTGSADSVALPPITLANQVPIEGSQPNGNPALSEQIVMSASGLTVSGRLAPVSLAVSADGRVLLTGPNGAGKSTLLAALAGEVEPDGGSIRLAPAARVGYLPQEVSWSETGRTVAETYAHAVGTELAELRPLTGSGLLAPRDIDRPIGELSVGQRRRLALATLVADPPAILLLDEPTNHLSLTLVEELEEALHQFAGALIIATHDRWFRSRWQHSVVSLG